MNTVLILALLPLLLVIILESKKGFTSYLALFLNLAILIVSIVLIIFGVPIYVVTFFFCIIIGACSLLVLNNYNAKARTTSISTIVTTILLIILIYLSVYFGHLQDFSTGQQDGTYAYSVNIGIDMIQFMVSTIVLAVITAVIDLTITINSPIYELHQVNPTLTQYELLQSGMCVGEEVLAASTNTIRLTFSGGQLALFIWFLKLKYSSGCTIDSGVFTREPTSITLGGIAITISIPITTWITASLTERPSQRHRSNESVN